MNGLISPGEYTRAFHAGGCFAGVARAGCAVCRVKRSEGGAELQV